MNAVSRHRNDNISNGAFTELQTIARILHHGTSVVHRKHATVHNGAIVCCHSRYAAVRWLIVVIYCPSCGSIVSGVWVSASFQIIPQFVGRLGLEVRVSVSFQSFALLTFVSGHFFAVPSVIIYNMVATSKSDKSIGIFKHVPEGLVDWQCLIIN